MCRCRRHLILAAVAIVVLPARSAVDGAPGAATCTLPFGNTVYATSGEYAGCVTIADFDGLNGPDLAARHYYGIDVLLNRGDGTFAAAGWIWADELGFVAIRDLDGVSGPDFVIVDWDGLHVLLNQGDGTFAGVLYGGDWSTSVAIADLDRVNGPDLVVRRYVGVGVSVLLNHGDGTFDAAVTYDAEGGLFAIGDLDGVNGPDLAVAGDNVRVLLNRGDGTFAAAVTYDAKVGLDGIVIVDLDGDKGPDLVVKKYGVYDIGCDCYVGAGVSVLLNQGDGTFAAAVTYDAERGPFTIDFVDLDAANGPDLVVKNHGVYDIGCDCYVGAGVSVLLNQGDGTFAAGVTYDAEGDFGFDIDFVDLDGVNGPDLVVRDHEIRVLLNQGDGTFAAAVAYHTGPVSVTIADLDGVDGPDLVLANAVSDDVSVLLNQGDGTFVAAVTYDVIVGCVSIGDLDGVNGPDLVMGISVSEMGYVSVLLNQGCLGAPCPSDLNGDGQVAIADFLGLLEQWGTNPGGPPDFDGDGVVGYTDFEALLGAWGPCP